MKILYFIPGALGRHRGTQELLRRRAFLARHAASGTEVEVEDAPEGPPSIESSVEEYLAVPEILKGVARAERSGFEAVILGCFGDPGLDAAREIATIPIVGPCEASLVASLPLGHRVSIVSVLPNVAHSLRKIARVLGLESRLASVRWVGVPVLELAADRSRSLSAFVEQGRRAIEEDGADVLVPGCMSMAFLGVAEDAQKQLGAPVVNPAVVSLKLAELFLAAGLSHSKRAYPHPPK